MFEQLGLIGCGLMGGSFAMALKKAGLVKRVVGYSKSPSTTERARQMGIIDVEAPSALLAVSGADIVLIAVPVSATEASFKAIKHLVTPDMLIMDVGSTKRDVIDAARPRTPLPAKNPQVWKTPTPICMSASKSSSRRLIALWRRNCKRPPNSGHAWAARF